MKNASLTVWALFLGTLLAGLGRFTVPTRPVFTWAGSYEALAHIWVGVLVAWVAWGMEAPAARPGEAKESVDVGRGWFEMQVGAARCLALVCLLLVTALEVAVYMVTVK